MSSSEAKATINENDVIMDIQQVVDGTNKYSVATRWDLIYLFYLIGHSPFAMVLGVSTDFNRILFASTYIHFAGEDIVAVHMLYTPKTAKILSIVICVAYSLEAVLFTPFASVELVQKAFGIQFIFSDVLSALSALCLMMNNRTSPQMRNCAFAILLHFIGVSMGLIHVTVVYIQRQHFLHQAEVWVAFILTVLFQLYLIFERRSCLEV